MNIVAMQAPKIKKRACWFPFSPSDESGMFRGSEIKNHVKDIEINNNPNTLFGNGDLINLKPYKGPWLTANWIEPHEEKKTNRR
ncbi:hypothetical protein FIM04_02590 [SAR202 cluster bacterium AC-409-J13_OGT_754m]|nr:hypothetical protein [SAR202 cluster bacterium AC-409-J13_OGT_754m]